MPEQADRGRCWVGYLSDWNEAERAAVEAQAAHPDCTRKLDCPAIDHLLECRRYRADLRSRMVAEYEAEHGEITATELREVFPND